MCSMKPTFARVRAYVKKRVYSGNGWEERTVDTYVNLSNVRHIELDGDRALIWMVGDNEAPICCGIKDARMIVGA